MQNFKNCQENKMHWAMAKELGAKKVSPVVSEEPSNNRGYKEDKDSSDSKNQDSW